MAFNVRPAMNRDAAAMAFQGLQQRREAAPLSPVGSPAKLRAMGAPPKQQMQQAPAQQYQQAPDPRLSRQQPQQQQTKASFQGAPTTQTPQQLLTYQQAATPLRSTGSTGGQLPGTTAPPVINFDKPSGAEYGSGGTPPDTRVGEDSLEALYEKSIREMLGYKRDSAAEEALIREAIEGKTGGELNDSRAGMGRAGFGGSGAGQALEGDIMREAGLASSAAQLDARRTADMDRLGAMSGGLGAANDQRSLAIQEKAFELALQMLADQEGTTVPGESPPPIIGDGGSIIGTDGSSGGGGGSGLITVGGVTTPWRGSFDQDRVEGAPRTGGGGAAAEIDPYADAATLDPYADAKAAEDAKKRATDAARARARARLGA